MADELAEVFDDDFGFLGDVMGVEPHEAGESLGRLFLLHFGIFGRGAGEAVIGTVGGVVTQHVEDEAFFDGLPHSVLVERLGHARRIRLPEDLHGFGLGSRGEGEKG